MSLGARLGVGAGITLAVLDEEAALPINASAAASHNSVTELQRRQRTARNPGAPVCLRAPAAQPRQRSCPQAKTKASVSRVPHSAQRVGAVGCPCCDVAMAFGEPTPVLQAPR
mmetsp:Transcript_5908/g.9500  ORF Transcript_5908/g.9500 Transcript_5908/m.9500 type:complete len:113 (-) Transcript_5908:39-377(-)